MEKYHPQCKTADGDTPIYLGTLINRSKIVTFFNGYDILQMVSIDVQIK